MEKLQQSLENLFKTASEQEKLFLGKNKPIKKILDEIKNYEEFLKNKLLDKSRTNLSQIYLSKEKIVGYNSFIILENAYATPYEREYIDMGKKLNYFYFKKIFVHPNYRDKGIGKELIESNLNLAKNLEKHSIIDANKDNYKFINLLLQFEFQEDFTWETPNKAKMVRFFHE